MTTNTALQTRAVNKLNRLKVGALFMEMGTGKTKVALDLMAAKKKADFFLWICPCSLKGTIEQERQKWHPELPLEVVGVESIGSSGRIYTELLSKLIARRCVFAVVDESLKIKNMGAQRTKRLLEISKLCEYKLILNGTPLTNNVLDLYSQFAFLSPLILPEQFREFKNNYCEYYTSGKRKGMIRCQCNIPNLVSRIKPYIFDAKLELEANKTFYTVDYDLTPQEREDYELIKYLFFTDSTKSEYDRIDFYTLITKLQTFLASSESKREALEKAVKDKGKTVCFVKFLASIPEGARRITGDMTQEARMQTIEDFRKAEGDQVLYITYGCGAFGLNLQFCTNMVFADRTWDYAMMKQAEARIYRLGQAEDVTYTTLKASGIGLEKMLTNNLSRKTDLLQRIKQNIESMSIKEQIKWLKSHL